MKKLRWFIILGAIALLTVSIGSAFFHPNPEITTTLRSDYEISGELPANQLSYYPVAQTPDLRWYRPVGNWIGRLLLPSVTEAQQQPGDWVWLELYHAPPEQAGLVGQKLRLTWELTPERQRYLTLVTTDVAFSEKTEQVAAQGNVVPTRLNGRKQVGPLQSLAGARPVDDVVVRFEQATLTVPDGQTATLKLNDSPEMVTGRYQALVKLVEEDPTAPPSSIAADCPGGKPCASDLFRVQHFNPNTQQFDGLSETIRIPQQPRVNNDRFMSTPKGLVRSPVGEAGWYVYGSPAQDGVFTVQALKPRSLFQLDPSQLVFRDGPSRHYIRQENWRNTPARKNTAQRVLVDSRSDSPDVALKQWQEGDRLLGMHLFGGIGGKLGEKAPLGTVTGHFALSLPRVIRDPFTQELQWDIPYFQIYAHNRQGILSGAQTWANYAGNLQRGWVFSRPFSDVMVQLDSLQDYDFGGVIVSPLQELQRQLEVMMARYRTGDGMGSARVTPAASCVQDANQALYITIKELQQQVQTTPAIQAWLAEHPNDPETRRFQSLEQLGDRLLQALEPRGIIRPDWQQNADTLAGVTETSKYGFVKQDTLAAGLLSWQSMLPRSGEDVLSQIFLAQGARLWFLRPNQIGGEMPDILPVAPTGIFGDVPVISTLARKTLGSVVLLPTRQDWSLMGICLGIYGAIAIPVGIKFRLLRWQPWRGSWQSALGTVPRLFFLPALVEELVFRVLLLPYPTDLNPFWTTLGAMALSLSLFVLYHPVNAWLFYPSGRPLFFQPRFLGLVALLGVGAMFIYWPTGSLWLVTIYHWAIVVVWLMLLGGELLLSPDNKR